MGKRKVWTEKDKIDLVHYLKKNMTWRAISEEFGVTPWQAQRFAHSLGLHNKGPYLANGWQIGLKVDEVLGKQVAADAKAKGITVSQLLRDILREKYQKRRSSPQDTEQG